jgi:hypothetical protein
MALERDIDNKYDKRDVLHRLKSIEKERKGQRA